MVAMISDVDDDDGNGGDDGSGCRGCGRNGSAQGGNGGDDESGHNDDDDIMEMDDGDHDDDGDGGGDGNARAALDPSSAASNAAKSLEMKRRPDHLRRTGTNTIAAGFCPCAKVSSIRSFAVLDLPWPHIHLFALFVTYNIIPAVVMKL